MKRIFIILLGLLLIPSLAFGAAVTYYVDTTCTDTNVGSATPDGTTYDPTTPACTGGAASYFVTIADINAAAATLNPGDSILFRKGKTWREQLTVPESGSAGNVYTFGAYGSGVDPIISGADLVSTWTLDNNKLTTDANTVGLYDLNQDVTDSSANERDLSSSGSPIYAASVFDYAFNDPATNSFYSYYSDAEGGDENAFDFADVSFTLEAWVKIESGTWSNGQDGWVVMKSTGFNSIGYGMRASSNGSIVWPSCLIDDDVAAVAHNQNNFVSIATGNWTHIACVVDRTNDLLELYVNGAKQGTGVDISGVGAVDNTVNFTIGAESDGGDLFEGQIEQVKVSNVARTTFPSSTGQENTWNATVTTQPKTVVFNTTHGTLVASKAAVNSANEWYWTGNVLSIYSTSDPDTAYTAPGIQAGIRDHAIYASAKDYITIDGIEAQAGNHATNGTIHFEQGSASTRVGITVTNCTVKYPAGYGIGFGHYADVGTTTDSEISSNTVIGGTFGINLFQVNASAGHENTIAYNDVSGFVTEGISVRGNYSIIEYNNVHDGGSLTELGGGIHLYSGGVGEGTGDNNIIRYNLVEGIRGHLYDGYGISADQWCDDNVIAYNAIYDTDGPGIYLFDSDGCSILNNTIYNACVNTAADGLQRGGIRLTSSAAPDNLTDNAVVKNNVCYMTSSSSYAVYVDANTYGNTLDITNNDWYRASGNWYFWNATGGATLATWNALTGVGTDLNSDPLFVNAAGGNFTLKPNSPAIGAGTDLGASYDDAIKPGSTWPSSVTTVDQDSYGSWEMGAYAFTYILSTNGNDYITFEDIAITGENVGILLDGTNNIVRDSVITAGTWGIADTGGTNQVDTTILIDQTDDAVVVTTAGSVFYNNVIYSPTDDGFDLQANAVICNCIFEGVGGTDIYENGGTNAPAQTNYLTATGDPLFVTPGANFRIQNTSPCRKAGTNLSLTDDADDKPWRTTPDIGAYQNEARPGMTVN